MRASRDRRVGPETSDPSSSLDAAGSFCSSTFGKDSHGRLRDVTLLVKRAAPSERSDVLVLMNATVRREGQALANRCARVRISAAIEKQPPERVIAPPRVIGHNTVEKRRVAPESTFIDHSARVHIRALVDQPARYVNILILNRHVEKRCAVEGRTVEGEVAVFVTAQCQG